MKQKVAIIMGSQSDLKIMKLAAEPLKKWNIKYDLLVVSAHRTPLEMLQFAETAEKKYSVIIAGAGGAAHLPGMVAALTCLPVIGVPVKITSLKGIDSLLSIMQMPKGIPVATVAIDNAYNAGILAMRILAVENLKIRNFLKSMREQGRYKVKQMNRKLLKGSSNRKRK